MIYTIKDVANKSGVSIGTVSKVLNNYPNVSETTKKKVMEAVRELNYIPNITASNLSSKKKNRIALYIKTNNNRQWIDEISMQYILGAFDCAKNDGLEIITVFYKDSDNQKTDEIIAYFASLGVSGIIVSGITKDDTSVIKLIESGQFKICVIDAPFISDNVSSIMIDHTKGQYEVAKKIINPSNDHNILYLAGGDNGYVTDMRIDGIKKLQEEYSFNLDIDYCNFSELMAYKTVLEKGLDYDVIVSASDMMAIGAINALIKLGVFKKVSGFDGITLLGYTANGMYTCRQDFYTISYEAVKEMESLLNNGYGRMVKIDHDICTIRHENIMT